MRRLLCLLALAGAILLAAPATGHAAEPGLVLGGNFFADGQIPQLDAEGAKWARVFMYWWDVEPTQTGPNEAVVSEYARALNAMHNNGAKTMVVLTGAPGWASGSSATNAPPRDPETFAHFAGAMASRLTSVDVWEIWNEPDANAYWANPDPARYAALLHGAYEAIKKANPRATVLFGGLTGNDYPFLEQAYAAGAKGSFDGVAVHTDTSCNLNGPYSYARDVTGRISQYSFLGYREVHNSMAANGDGDLPVWLTEMGWSASTGLCDRGPGTGTKAGGVSAADQATYLSQAYHCLAQDPYVKAALWFSLRDYNAQDLPDNRFGLVDYRGLGRPAEAAFRDQARRGDQLTEPCGDFAGPQLTVTSPAPGTTFSGTLPVRVSASDPSGVPAVALRVDDAQPDLRDAVDLTSPPSLDLADDWAPGATLADGPHRLTVSAVDALGNVSSTVIAVTKVPPQAPTVLSGRMTGRDAIRGVRARVTPAAAGPVRVVFQRQTPAGWRTGHLLTGDGAGVVAGSARLLPGRWRVRLQYLGAPAFAPSALTLAPFRVPESRKTPTS